MQHSEPVLGIDLGGSNIRAGLVRGGDVKRVVNAPTPADGTVEDVLSQIYALIETFDTDSLAGIGIGVPGLVDVEKKVVYDVLNIPSWIDEVPIGAVLENRYAIPTYVNNDANCFALGEYYFGKGQSYSLMVGVVLGTGFAGGVVLDGHLITGAHSGAGEFGMMPYRDSIYEYYCAGLFFERQYGLRGKEVFRRALHHDVEALDLFAELGEHLGTALKTVLCAYDPEIIIIGGSIRKAMPFFKEAMWDVLRTFSFPRVIEDLRIEVSELDHVAILGAAALTLGNT